jgi:hypothetical protein
MKKIALVACVLACAGCVYSASTRGGERRSEFLANEHRTTVDLATRADQAAGRADGVTAAATARYWLNVKAMVNLEPIHPRVTAQVIGRLPTEGVDPDLVREGQLVAEKMRAAAASIDSMPAVTILFHVPQSRWLEAEALSRAAVEQCQAVERLRPELTARYGVSFPTLDVPNP